MRRVNCICLCVLFASLSVSFVLADDKPNLLIIGDPIATGYADHLADMMKSDINVFKIAENSLATRVGVKDGKMAEYLNAEYDGKVRKWDAVVFHYGFWDIGRVPGAGGPRTSLGTYESRLEVIGKEIKKNAPDAKVIWSNIPALPEGDTEFHHDEDPGLYNEVSGKVMKGLDIPVIDVYSMTSPFDLGMRNERNRTIFNDKGYKTIAEGVKVRIEEILGTGKEATAPSLAGMEVGVRRKTGLYSSENSFKLIGYLQPGMTVKISEEVSSTKVKVSFESGGKTYEGICKKSDLEM